MELHQVTLRIGERTLVGAPEPVGPAGRMLVRHRPQRRRQEHAAARAGRPAPFDAGAASMDGRPLHAWPPQQLALRRAYLPQGRNDAFGYRAIDVVLAARHP